MNLNPEWSGKSVFEEPWDKLLKYEKEIKEHILIGSFLVYIPCMWTVNAFSLLNREEFNLNEKRKLKLLSSSFLPHQLREHLRRQNVRI